MKSIKKTKQILTDIDESYERITGTTNKAQFPHVYSELAFQQLFFRLDELELELELAVGRAK